MRVWQISSFGVDSLEFVERPTPTPEAGEVLVKVRAISFNYRDLLMVKGLYNPKLKLPRIPCSDGAGEVVAVGEGVTAWKPGDRVAAIFMQNWLDGPPTAAKVPRRPGRRHRRHAGRVCRAQGNGSGRDP